nr:TetR/AcrR family transcriptional regulator C-terminal domain-containing protein [Kineosporia babensis]
MGRDAVITEALDLLDDVGLDAVSTRALARRLGIEQPSLYWHFKNKGDLLGAMAEAAMQPHAVQPLPEVPQDWREWFLENTRSFRRTLLLRRDGARLHAGLRPEGDLPRLLRKMQFLKDSGVPDAEAQMAMLAASRFTVGSVLEEQADPGSLDGTSLPSIGHEEAFESGLRLILGGLEAGLERVSPSEQPASDRESAGAGR